MPYILQLEGVHQTDTIWAGKHPAMFVINPPVFSAVITEIPCTSKQFRFENCYFASTDVSIVFFVTMMTYYLAFTFLFCFFFSVVLKFIRFLTIKMYIAFKSSSIVSPLI